MPLLEIKNIEPAERAPPAGAPHSHGTQGFARYSRSDSPDRICGRGPDGGRREVFRLERAGESRPRCEFGVLNQGPAISKDGLSLYFGSNRPGGSGSFDIWVSQRGDTLRIIFKQSVFPDT
jgi:hypothetical protein